MKKKNAIIIAIILMSIGFASISTTLILNGSAKVSENNEDFSIIFTAASLDGNDVYSTVVDETKKIITFTTSELKTLNQTSILTYEVTNNSSNYDTNVTVTCVPKEGTTAKYTSIKNKLENDATVVKAKESVNGTLTVTLNKTATESVTEEYTCKLEFTAAEKDELGKAQNVFANDSWSTILTNVKNGNTYKYNIGDTKIVDLGSLGTHTVRISNMSECKNGETSETACGFVVEFADVIEKHNMNSTMTNVGGWPASNIKSYLNSAILNTLPSELKNVIVDTKVISGHGLNDSSNFISTDKLYFLSTKEIYGESSKYDSIDTETKQLDYYEQQGVTINNYSRTIKQCNGVKSYWWLRSASPSYAERFAVVNDAGGNGAGYAHDSVGISPAFRIA